MKTSKEVNSQVEEFCRLAGISKEQYYNKVEIVGSLDLQGTQITSLPENLTVGGDLDLRGTPITSLPDNLTVGGDLDLQGTQITSLPENLTVGGSLDLRGTQITSLPENLTVGGAIYMNGGAINQLQEVELPKLSLTWQNGRYIKKDGIFTEVISHHANVWQVRHIGSKEIGYLITDGNGNYAHGCTLEEAKEDLVYKVEDRKKCDYEHLTIEDTLTHEEAIKCYRTITGACSSGIRYFIKNIPNGNKKESYTIQEIIDLTKDQYGNRDFAAFFRGKPKSI